MAELRGKRVCITGASSGIGAACARAFAAAGAELVLCARRRDRLQQVVAGLGAPAQSIELDVRDRPSVERELGGLEVDVLLNNAGLARGLAPVQEGSPDDWDEMLDTNVKGLLYVTRALLPGLIRRQGHVLNIGSLAGHEVYPKGNVYCASKHAVRALNHGLRLDLLGTGVRVSSVDPGLVGDTEFSAVRFHGDRERAASVYRGLTPLSAADVAETVLWVATRPAHVLVAEVLLLATDQASSTLVHRRT
ncbi:MAG: SDR family NAD(P)-dependent oxidoreductase [Planctomycetota bacterium]|nr:MAG: SDR family NAD(P)-dependent oxidoreductase [Planctomycetota bacterium]